MSSHFDEDSFFTDNFSPEDEYDEGGFQKQGSTPNSEQFNPTPPVQPQVEQQPQQQQPQGNKGISHKKAGIIIFVVLIFIALGVTLLSKIHITSKSNTTQNVTTPQTNQQNTNTNQVQNNAVQSQTNSKGSQTEVQQSQTNSKESLPSQQQSQTNSKVSQSSEVVSQSPSKESTSTNKQTQTTANSDTNQGWNEIDNDSINYNSPALKSSGTVVGKRVFLNSNGQLIYALVITIKGVGVDSVEYYCGYDAFASVNKNDLVSISYKKVTDSAFAILGISK